MLRLIGLWLANVFGSAIAALAGYVAVRQFSHAAEDSRVAILGGLIPITAAKFPWVVVLLATLAALWFVVRLKGDQRGAAWGLRIWGLELGISWSIVALLLFAGTLSYGLSRRSLSDLNWAFSLGYLAVAVIVLTAFLGGWRMTHRIKATG